MAPALIGLLVQYKYAFLLLATTIEGPIATAACGFLLSLGVMNVWIALPVAIAGDVLGDIIHYGAGRLGN